MFWKTSWQIVKQLIMHTTCHWNALHMEWTQNTRSLHLNKPSMKKPWLDNFHSPCHQFKLDCYIHVKSLLSIKCKYICTLYTSDRSLKTETPIKTFSNYSLLKKRKKKTCMYIYYFCHYSILSILCTVN